MAITGPDSFRKIIEECERDEAMSAMAEIRAYLDENCLHYNQLWLKFDGGRCPMYCGLCGALIGQWTPKNIAED